MPDIEIPPCIACGEASRGLATLSGLDSVFPIRMPNGDPVVVGFPACADCSPELLAILANLSFVQLDEKGNMVKITSIGATLVQIRDELPGRAQAN